MPDYKGSSKYFSKNRIETLVDGIFAIAMTLLVLDLVVPHINGPVTNAALNSALAGIIPLVSSMVLSFVLLALFWNIHHRIYNQVETVHGYLLWTNIIWLLFIVLVPFSASLNGEYGDFIISNVIFNINMLGIASLLYINIYMLNRGDFINEHADHNSLAASENSTLFFIIIAVVGLFLSFIIPSFSTLVYLLIIPFELRDHIFN